MNRAHSTRVGTDRFVREIRRKVVLRESDSLVCAIASGASSSKGPTEVLVKPLRIDTSGC